MYNNVRTCLPLTTTAHLFYCLSNEMVPFFRMIWSRLLSTTLVFFVMQILYLKIALFLHSYFVFRIVRYDYLYLDLKIFNFLPTLGVSIRNRLATRLTLILENRKSPDSQALIYLFIAHLLNLSFNFKTNSANETVQHIFFFSHISGIL